MQVSARILGKDYGLTGEGMNRLLKKLDFLTGEPGNYTPTEKAMPFVKEHDFHRGCGGYQNYNRYWTTRTFDDSIKEQLDVTPDLIDEVRNELIEIRKARSEALAAARQAADEEFKAAMAAKEAQELAEALAKEKHAKKIAYLKKGGEVTLVLLVTCGITYVVYKNYPSIKKWYINKIRKNKDSECVESTNGSNSECEETAKESSKKN